ncbi:MAG: hypothetical protein ACREA3_02855 [Nitrosotalea sp.]
MKKTKPSLKFTSSIILIILCLTVSFTDFSAFAQSTADEATLLIYTDVPWSGTIDNSSNSTSISGNSAASYSFACKYGNTYSVTLQSAGSTGTGMEVWTVANLIQDGKMLDVGVNRLAYGTVNLSGNCHTAQFPMSNTGMVSFSTDKTIYQYVDPIQISGIVLPGLQRNYILSSTIINSDGMIMRKDSTLFGTTPTFYFSVHAQGGAWKPGNYKVLVEIANSVAEADITINSVQQTQSNPTVKTGNHFIPGWIKNTAKWWVEGKISDSEFNQAMQYLVQQGAVKIPYFYSPSISTQSLLGWIKANTSLWANGKMSDDQFVNVLKYLNFVR